ncbi:hypothetical protein BDV06DRAFT_208531 [Aspergillus oleicola]
MTPPPVPPAQPGEHQFWTNPILCEETRARLEHFRSLGWLPPNFKPKTLEGLAVLKEDYSYDEYWRRLCQYFGLFARRRVNGNVHEQMRQFLEHVLPAERKISRRIKNKNTLDVDVFCVTYRHHWVYSKHFRHGIDDLPALVCYRDIKLFILKDPDSKRDVLCVIIKFRNLKGRPEGADGTKFFMHGNYQLAYCPINQIILLAFRDDTFLNNILTPELICQQALKELGRDARFKDNISHYKYCWWTANKVNRNFTSQERQRFINHDLQHVVLLRPPQEGLLRVAGSMLRKRDPLALSGLTNVQKRIICQHPKVLELRQEKRELMEEMRSLASTIRKAQEPFPYLY